MSLKCGALKWMMLAFITATLVTPGVWAETSRTQGAGESPQGSAPESAANTLAGHIRALDAPDAAVRLEAAQALGELSSPDAVQALARVARSDPVPEVRGWCVHSLHQIGTPEAHTAISDAARNDRNERVRDLAASLCRDCAPAPRPSTDTPSPFPAAAPSTPTGSPQTSPQIDPSAQAAAQPLQAVPPATPEQYSPPQDPQLRSRGIRALVTGIVLLVTSSIPFALGGVLVPRWEEVRVDGDTTEWHRTAAYPGSIILFILGSALSIPGIALTAVGAARLSRSRPDQQSSARISSLSPFATPTSDGGAIFGFTGCFF